MQEEIKAYCVKCKAERTIVNARITRAGDRIVAKGTCPVCGARVTHFIEKREHAP